MLILPIGDINPRERTPIVNYAVIIANITVFILFNFRPDYEELVLSYGLIPARRDVLTFFTSMFLHGGLIHLAGNMLFLWICGDNVEDRLGHLGYLLMYVASGIGAAMAHIYMTTTPEIPTIGASGAISGVMGAYVVLFPFSKIKFWYLFWFYIIIRSGTFMVASIWALGFWFAEQFLFGYLGLLNPQLEGGVAYWAHIGGFVFAIAVTLFLRVFGIVRKPKRRYKLSG